MSGLGGAPVALPGVEAGRCRRRTGRGSGRCGGIAGPRSGRPGRGGVGPFAWVPADWATVAVKLGGRPFGELRPALAWRDDLKENGGALDGVRALPAAKGKNLSSAAASIGRWDIVPGNEVYRRFARSVSFPADDKTKARRSHSLPLQ